MTEATAKQPEETVVNGVNVSALMETIDAVASNPEIADFHFRAANTWMGGDHNRTTIRDFDGACETHTHAHGPFTADNAEPPVLLGEGAAPNPVEYVLHALAGCLTTTLVYHAAARGIEVADVSSELEGDLDLRGFLGMSDEIRRGFHHVRVRMKVKTDASADMMASLARFSPVYEMISKSLPVDLTVDVV